MTFLSCHQWLTSWLAGWLERVWRDLVAGDSDWANYLPSWQADCLQVSGSRHSAAPAWWHLILSRFVLPPPWPIALVIVVVVATAGMAEISNWVRPTKWVESLAYTTHTNIKVQRIGAGQVEFFMAGVLKIFQKWAYENDYCSSLLFNIPKNHHFYIATIILVTTVGGEFVCDAPQYFWAYIPHIAQSLLRFWDPCGNWRCWMHFAFWEDEAISALASDVSCLLRGRCIFFGTFLYGKILEDRQQDWIIQVRSGQIWGMWQDDCVTLSEKGAMGHRI